MLREGIDVMVADESSMRPVVGTAGPACQAQLFMVRTMPCGCVVHLETMGGSWKS